MVSKTKIRSYCFHNNIYAKKIDTIEEIGHNVHCRGLFQIDNENFPLLEIVLSDLCTDETLKEEEKVV